MCVGVAERDREGKNGDDRKRATNRPSLFKQSMRVDRVFNKNVTLIIKPFLP